MKDDIDKFLAALPAGTKEAAAWQQWADQARIVFRDAWLARTAAKKEEFRVLPENAE